jgi:hypothetical protein
MAKTLYNCGSRLSVASLWINQQIHMTSSPSDPLDNYIDAAARVLGLSIAPEWQPVVRANLQVSLSFARMVEDFPLPDDSEPAHVFKA